MPGTPGTLSEVSPTSAWTSITFAGGTPKYSSTPASSIRRSGRYPGLPLAPDSKS
jgi:hypothetical protein